MQKISKVFILGLVSLLTQTVVAATDLSKEITFLRSDSINTTNTLYIKGEAYDVEINKDKLLPIVKLNSEDFDTVFSTPKFRIRVPFRIPNPLKPIVKVTICHREFKINLVDIILCEQSAGAVAAACVSYGAAGCIPAIGIASKMCGLGFDEINNACKNQ